MILMIAGITSFSTLCKGFGSHKNQKEGPIKKRLPYSWLPCLITPDTTCLESIWYFNVLGLKAHNFIIIAGFGRGLMGLDRATIEVYLHPIWQTQVVRLGVTAIQSWDIWKYTSPAKLSNFRGLGVGLGGGARKLWHGVRESKDRSMTWYHSHPLGLLPHMNNRVQSMSKSQYWTYTQG